MLKSDMAGGVDRDIQHNWAVWPLAVTLGLTIALAAIGMRFYPLDDAYITLHNARVIWAGNDPNFKVPPLIGATSPIHLAIVTSLFPMFGAASPAIVSFFSTFLYLVGVRQLCRKYFLSMRAEFAVAILSIGSGYVIFQCANGLETALALAAVIWILVLADGERPKHRVAVLCGLLPFIRPELIALSGPLMVRQICLQNRRENAASNIALDIGLAAFAALPWLLWSWLSTGTPPLSSKNSNA